ncbi:para-nitrobenzyl esterase [Didymella exigua CBS 183.55]|uniref:Carboxylic ester hydrolase n=1 Tax=Didymella exigua CBS 183.55 TaxID=1150837 RepID=A0A6A5S234_9PLEO|nr:para-nitrobenzyl esterase [Didymella exigua CBS 183.55]KAF1933358.1 para-nitrobenzyl esterase [Didymella exigua CBS 183.55]
MKSVLFLALPCAHALSSLFVDTSSGLVQGTIDAITPNVVQFLGVPYAEPPVGARRWLPSLPRVREGGKVLNATHFGPSCPQYYTNKSTTWLTDASEFNIEPREYQSEDCLSVNIWVPWLRETAPERSPKLPVIVWIHGGSFQTGGASAPYHNPSRWVERSREHIVVAINYRLNIFGWPNAKGLRSNELNLGYLDQRLALEWVQGNIHAFGGDSNRITLWGQSAGAVSVDSYNFAYPHDPIISGLILSSGTAQSVVQFGSPNFTAVAENFNCGDQNATAELKCMQDVPFPDIIAFLRQRLHNGTIPSFSFTPVVDNRTSWANHTTRVLSGNFIRKPAIIGTTVNEWGPFLPYNQTFGPNQTLADEGTLRVFLCPSVLTTHERFAGGNQTTFRYLYGGNFSNIAPRWWQGAYHSADLPLVFGTHDIARGDSTPLEIAVSQQMQDYWLAFAKDPENGLPERGWRGYSGKSDGTSALFGWDDEAIQPLADSDLESACDEGIPNGKPKPPKA